MTEDCENNLEKYMLRCLALAKKSEGFVSPNPLVGAIVLDKNGNLAGEGRHERYGEAHAEVNAFKDADDKGIEVKGGTIFVNLEPCSHYGKTPPCADLIIKKGIKKVVIGCVDPNPIVDGGGIKKLKDAGIVVVIDVLKDDCKKINEIFFKNQMKKLPFTAIKTATTADGKIASKTGSSKWITSEKAREHVQYLRNKYDAILTGSGTILADNPSLTCRMKEGRNPIRVVIDSTLKTPADAKVYNDDGTKVYIACSQNAVKKEYGKNVEKIICPLVNRKIDLNFLSQKLFEKGIMSILVEAGGELNGAFLKSGLIDKVYQFIAPKILGDKEAKSFVEGFDIEQINECTKLVTDCIKILKPDILIEFYIHSI